MFDKTMTQDELNRLYDATVIDQDGDKVGGVGQIYLDDQTDRPTWATVKTGLFGTRETFVPLRDASISGNEIRVPFQKSFIKDAPNVDADGHVTPEEEAELYRYYGRHEGDVTTREGVVRDTAAAGVVGTDHVREGEVRDAHLRDEHLRDRNEDGSVVLNEERLHVGTERVETGRVRLRKHVVTEQRTVTVPVTREEVVVEREPIRDGEHAGHIGDDATATVVLHEERPVVSKETVATERVSLGTQQHTEERQVSETVAKEQVEVEREGGVRTERDGIVDGHTANPLDRNNDGHVNKDDLHR